MQDIQNLGDINFFETFNRVIIGEKKKMGHVNLVIAGKTGVGKSTLINAAFRENIAETGIGRPVTDEMRLYKKEDFPLRIYDTIGLELDEEKRKKTLEDIKRICDEGKYSDDPDKMMHIMWYCVNTESDRFEQFEADYINEISEKIDVILVLTKSFKKKRADKMIQEIKTDYPGLKAKQIVRVLAQDEEDCDEDETPKKAYGVDKLIEVTAQILPESAQKAWCNAQKASMELKVRTAHNIVMTTAAASFGEGFIPIPFSDSLALVPTQLAMLAGITATFGVSVSEHLLKTIVTSMAGVSGTTFVGRTIVSGLLKMIPGIGTAVGGAISGATASVLTIALGESYIGVMKMIVEGEIDEKDIDTEEFTNTLKDMYKTELQKKM